MQTKTEISKKMLEAAKKQFYAGIITFPEFQELLTIIYYQLSDLENDAQKKEYFLKVFQDIDIKINLKETLNVTLAMN